MLQRSLLTAALLLVSFTLPISTAAAVEKPYPTYRRGDGYTYYREYRSDRPIHGYEGFAGPPLQSRYCSYQRIPNRVCDRRGCRVESWTLQQFCH